MNPDEPFSLGESWVFEVRLLAGASVSAGFGLLCVSVPGRRADAGVHEPVHGLTHEPVHGLTHEPVHEPVHDGLHVSARPLGESIR